ncbi:MAG: AAA family ATPase [Corynebacterium sp.]|uniref:AAA family ATPase n=1 Tax=Corynebacterium sp. TaxID=1720 RepID=UPI0026E01851|nr:AAA family ATPase [Corynebacterium sp.]MDO5670606.1 AAA family ATPase [Corynebacterium sp.]
MRIHSLHIENFRGIERLTLDELPDTGVIVIHGDNEQGKSTILDALHAALHDKHGGRSGRVRAWQPVGRDVSPTVSVTATIGPVTFTITKNWLKSPKAELHITAPQREVPLTGGPAEEKLAEIIARYLDRDLAETLFMRQGDLDAGIAAVGINSVTRALDGVSEDGDSGTEDTALSAAVEKEYERYFTAKGAPARELKAAQRAYEDATEEHTAAARAQAELTGYVERHDKISSRRAAALADLPDAETDEHEHAEKARHAAQAQEKAAALRRELQLADEALQRAEVAVTRRAELVAEVSAAQSALMEHSAGLAEAQERRDLEKQQLDSLGQRLKEAQRSQESATVVLRAARHAQRMVADAARRTTLSTQLSAIRELSEKITLARATTAGRAVGDADVRAVEDATNDLILARRLRAQAAARLEITGPAGTSITVDGDTVSLDASIELSEGTELVIGDITARYRAGHADSSGEDPVAAAEEVMRELLDGLDLPDLDAVRAARDTHRRASEDLAGLLRERTTLLAGEDKEVLEAELARLETDLADVQIPELDVAAAARAVEEAEEAREQAGREVEKTTRELTPWQERRAENALTALTVRIEEAQKRLRQAQEAVESAAADSDDDSLAQAVQSATAARDEVAEQCRLADEEVEAADPELATDLHRGALSRLESVRDTIARSGEDLAELTGYIRQAQGAAERLDKAVSAMEAAKHRLESVTRRAEAVKLLRETLHRHRAEARARYAQPFAEQLTRLARPVFGPDVEFGLSDQLQVTQRSIGADTVPLADLSGGAKEQLAILTRFAIAQLTALDTGDGQVPVPVIVDDALGSSDSSRLQLMATLFSRMGDTGQVIVLTCVPQRYERVSGRTEYAIEELKAGVLAE